MHQVKSEMDKRVDELDNLELTSQNKAELILEHADLVEAAIQIIRSAVASGMPWDDLSGTFCPMPCRQHAQEVLNGASTVRMMLNFWLCVCVSQLSLNNSKRLDIQWRQPLHA